MEEDKEKQLKLKLQNYINMAGLGKQKKGTGIAKVIKENRVAYKDGTNPKEDPIEEQIRKLRELGLDDEQISNFLSRKDIP